MSAEAIDKGNEEIAEENRPLVPNFKTQDREIILRSIAEVFGVDVKEFIAGSRKTEIRQPRFAAAELLFRKVGLSYPRIGTVLGNQDHTTAIHAIKRSKELTAKDPEYARRVAQSEALADLRMAEVRKQKMEAGLKILQDSRL